MMLAKITIYNMRTGTEQPRIISVTQLDLPKDALIKAIAAVRAGLPKHCAAALNEAATDRNIR